MNTLIGDVGSTKGHWAYLSQDGQFTFETTGFNPVQHQTTLISEMLSAVKRQCPDQIHAVHYYGAGVISEATRQLISSACESTLKAEHITCESDMLAAARALTPDAPGVVCILGTGSNSCVFDGEKITTQIPSLGFPLGDEGSGADIGKACVRAFYYGILPAEVHEAFATLLPANRSVFLDHFRTNEAGNRYLAMLVPIAARFKDTGVMRGILLDCFCTFARLHIAPYNIAGPVHFSGGVAFAFKELLGETLKAEHLIAGTIIKSPLSRLIEFHQNH